MTRFMIELAIIGVGVSLCVWAGLLTSHHFSTFGLLALVLGLIGAAYLALEALVAFHRDWENVTAAIVLWFCILPAILGFGGGAVFGRGRNRGGQE
ncbi:hypothetical protein [Roseobacter sinensis]|uniref:Uncharacterized protein n=1 Tax=Roseobacter sinensis TaxID=2931391 RepID=A0ABT3BJZ4_9RHOB|nr:hypothetical protein [Roseobacter sp. WL0113]MCV3273898.1 hypothetical protein [Roseobacter sp. WL0113]